MLSLLAITLFTLLNISLSSLMLPAAMLPAAAIDYYCHFAITPLLITLMAIFTAIDFRHYCPDFIASAYAIAAEYAEYYTLIFFDIAFG
jgi:hypothetical protein